MRPSFIMIPIAGLALFAGTVTLAQIEGSRGIAPIDSSGNYEVSGVRVDVLAKTAEAARYAGWQMAQRKAWGQLSKRLGGDGSAISDGALNALVSAIAVENEEIGPNRYIAKLGVLFDRQRTAALLGISSYASRSPPMLVLPVQWSGGVGEVFEQRTAWQSAWARYRTGNSTIDYVRPSGNGADSLLLNTGQISRPGRGRWRKVLDQYGATDVVMPAVRLYRQWPGGPIIGVFEARFGPDNVLIDRFTLRVGRASGLPQLLDTGVARMDGIYQSALNSGRLRPDPSLSPPPAPTPVEEAVESDALAGIIDDVAAANAAAANITVTIQYDTPGAAAVTATESTIRTLPGVQSAATSSLALGGVSLMKVVYQGEPDGLKASLQAQGYQVLGTGQTLRIRGGAAPAPSVPSDGPPNG